MLGSQKDILRRVFNLMKFNNILIATTVATMVSTTAVFPQAPTMGKPTMGKKVVT